MLLLALSSYSFSCQNSLYILTIVYVITQKVQILDCSGPTTSVTVLYLWQRDFNVQPLNMFLTPLAISTSMCALSSERRCICGYKKVYFHPLKTIFYISLSILIVFFLRFEGWQLFVRLLRFVKRVKLKQIDLLVPVT